MHRYFVRSITIFTALFVLTACSHNTQTSAIAGMDNIAPNVYVDKAMPKQNHKAFLQTVEQSKNSIINFFGDMQSNPDIYACYTSKCFLQFGGIPAIAKSYDDNKVLLSKRGLDSTTLTHEMVHVEFHKRLGSKEVWNKVPMWFDEGLAALACRDPNYKPTKISMPLDELVTSDQWVKAIRKDIPAYSISKQAVQQWFETEGLDGLSAIIDHMRKGHDFKLINKPVEIKVTKS